ncbi:hypothetical protein R5H30_21620 [Sulfitobacter sp. D35]|uniref:hypothetical protein n=1 Tax=Sulfitobacter sp. D35 TaxID=3083252 RepID=UPI00296E445D|nr:hypothetical protein [Sulfitobacter sp. D35]MDW4500596.1 hypothetical protein [Sulfitobacter sp. D35]
MTYWYLLFGFAALLAAATLRQQSAGASIETFGGRESGFRLGNILLGIAGVALLVVGFASVNVTLSSETWYERSPIRELILFGVMALGMLARMLSLSIENRREFKKKNPGKTPGALDLDAWDLVYPFLSSSICFGALMQATSEEHLGALTLCFAFQNGFFWQTIVGGAKPS